MDVKKIVQELKKAYNVNTNEQLANKLSISIHAVEQWSKRKKVPDTYIFKCINDTGVKFDWLLNEKGIIVEEAEFDNENIQKTLGFIKTMTDSNKELEVKFNQILLDFIKENLK